MKIQGHIVNHDEEFDGTVDINEITGIIESVEKNSKFKIQNSKLATEGCLIFPGFTDLHVHAREDVSGKENYKEDFKTASQAALAGGVTQFAEMPNNPVPPVDAESYSAKEKLAQARSLIPVVLYAGIGPNTKPLTRNVPYKVYMAPSTNSLGFNSFAELEKTIALYFGKVVTFHCEDSEILKQHASEKTHESRRPIEAEVSAIDFALKLIAKYNLEGKLCHISTKKGVEMIRAAKIHGSRVTAEASPHHMFFEDVAMQINPPIRSHEDRLAVIEGLKDGTLDYLATDHSPHTIEDKNSSGMPHLDTYGPFVTWLMKEHGFTPRDIARVCSYNPGNFISPFLKGSTPPKAGGGISFGKIEKGYAGSLTIIDINKPIKILAKDLKTKCGWSPFENITFPGSVKYTVSLGKFLLS